MKSAVEPVRKSLLDVVRKNLRAAGKTTYITRVVYIGEYTGEYSNLEEKMGSVIHQLQEDYNHVTISGLLLVYPEYYIHVLERFFTEWHHVYTIPPTLLQKLESYKLEDIQTQMSICFSKVYELCDHISNTVRDYSVPIKEVIRNINDKIARLYPESTLLEYLLNANSPVILTVEEYLKIFSSVPFISLYSGNKTTFTNLSHYHSIFYSSNYL
ncbi:hypothetical protein WH47_00364 [Habropoda laboriosa]|uniref:BLUF domain-containing protein n=1 Tax=Habropoda laboriosa TaxID=597456 RepID=A0A0L7R262_9HYME|nr:hypothetical protein WH47_00364 [Habropoda laboriosa]